jgi:hypothetical protein
MSDTDSIRAYAMYNLNKRIIEKASSTTLLNKRCFILAGGESLRGVNLSRLNKEITIGINRAYETFPEPTYNYLMDLDLYQDITQDVYGKESKNKFINSQGLKICLAIPAHIIYHHNCYVVNRIYTETVSKDIANGIHSGNNCGHGAISLAISMGCKDIYLLGYDMQAKKFTHSHSGYSYDLKECNERCAGFKKELEYWAPKWKEAKVNVTQLIIENEQETALDCFNKRYFRHVVMEGI